MCVSLLFLAEELFHVGLLVQKASWKSDWEKFEQQVAGMGLIIRDIRGDGNCMFRSVNFECMLAWCV